MKATFSDGGVLIELPGVNLPATFENGQAFRWRALEGGAYEGVAGRHRAVVRGTERGLWLSPCTPEQFEGFWRHYLDLDYDYAAAERALADDAVLAPIVACCAGMRILNQPIWECLASFLLSSNNNVRRISSIIERLCACFGEDMGGYRAFPTARALAEAGEAAVFACGAGYRAAYLYRTAVAVAGGFDLERLPAMGYEAAREALMGLRGVGGKVADCVLLFSCGYRQAFPVDVWVRRAVALHYPGAGATGERMLSFAEERFGCRAGLAQQMLFHYERVCKGRSPRP